MARAWSPSHRGRLLASLPTDSETWTLAAEIDPETEAAYWQFAQGWALQDEAVVPVVAKYIAHGRAKHAVHLLGMRLPNRKVAFTPEFVANALETAAKGGDEDESPGSMLAYQIAELIHWLNEQQFDQSKVARLEWIYLPVFAASRRTPKALHIALAKSPDLFIELLSAAFRAENEEPAELTDEQKQRARRALDVLHQWRTLPGIGEQGTISSQALLDWVAEARRRAAAAARANIGDYMIGEMLSGSNFGSDGAWPHEAVRAVIERVESERLENGIEIGKYNARGGHWRAPGGSQEFALAAQYANFAARCADRWPRTAALLRGIERKYKGEARWHEAREEIGD